MPFRECALSSKPPSSLNPITFHWMRRGTLDASLFFRRGKRL